MTHVYILPLSDATHSKSCQVHSASTSHMILNVIKAQYFFEVISSLGGKKNMLDHALWPGCLVTYSGPHYIMKELCTVLGASGSVMRVSHERQHNTPPEESRAHNGEDLSL